MQLELYRNIDLNILTEEIFTAYYDCRRNKRNTVNALAFEKHLEKKLFQLTDEIYTGTFQQGRSIAFIVNKPVKREIFAADFRDRVVHHWLINKLNPLFEQLFITDSYACRKGKGTHYGIKKINEFIKEASNEYKEDCFILKLDIQGFFMHIDRVLLYNKLIAFIDKAYKFEDKFLVEEIIHKIVFNNSASNCTIKGSKKDWQGLPNDKSLFHSPKNCGLPIGNLTSQVFANFYMNEFDYYIKNVLKIKYYGRYVDDFVLIHNSKEKLKNLIPIIRKYLKEKLQLTLHPKKIYLQHYNRGVQFLGTVIKPYRIYITNRTKGNFYDAVKVQNEIVRNHRPNKDEKAYFLSVMNSYLGILMHYRTYKIRKVIINEMLSAYWFNYFYPSKSYSKMVSRVKIVKRV